MTCSSTHIVPRCPSCANPDHGSAACPTTNFDAIRFPRRLYNGPTSPMMDKIYDALTQHIDVSELDDWPIISLHLARVIKEVYERKRNHSGLAQN